MDNFSPLAQFFQFVSCDTLKGETIFFETLAKLHFPIMTISKNVLMPIFFVYSTFYDTATIFDQIELRRRALARVMQYAVALFMIDSYLPVLKKVDETFTNLARSAYPDAVLSDKQQAAMLAALPKAPLKQDWISQMRINRILRAMQEELEVKVKQGITRVIYYIAWAIAQVVCYVRDFLLMILLVFAPLAFAGSILSGIGNPIVHWLRYYVNISLWRLIIGILDILLTAFSGCMPLLVKSLFTAFLYLHVPWLTSIIVKKIDAEGVLGGALSAAGSLAKFALDVATLPITAMKKFF